MEISKGNSRPGHPQDGTLHEDFTLARSGIGAALALADDAVEFHLISAAGFLLYDRMVARFGGIGRWVCVSREELGGEAMSPGTVTRNIKRLVACGLIEMELGVRVPKSRRRMPNRYRARGAEEARAAMIALEADRQAAREAAIAAEVAHMEELTLSFVTVRCEVDFGPENLMEVEERSFLERVAQGPRWFATLPDPAQDGADDHILPDDGNVPGPDARAALGTAGCEPGAAGAGPVLAGRPAVELVAGRVPGEPGDAVARHPVHVPDQRGAMGQDQGNPGFDGNRGRGALVQRRGRGIDLLTMRRQSVPQRLLRDWRERHGGHD